MMKIVFWGEGLRAFCCLKTLLDEGFVIDLVVVGHENDEREHPSVLSLAETAGIETINPPDPNSEDVESFLKTRNADLFILVGYEKILRDHIIRIPKAMCINLHGGKLPQYRGSFPLNWVLINGESSFTLSIFKVDAGIDTGDILLERTFVLARHYTIRDLHQIANEQYPSMLVDVITHIQDNTYVLTPQDNVLASYYPPRFPDDGVIFWDIYTSEQIHNRIRALTESYCAFTFFQGKKIMLRSSELYDYDYFGEPGRIYKKSSKRGLLVCALDKCVWITDAIFWESRENVLDAVKRYDKFDTIRDSLALKMMSS